jgi:hypothetical protein
MTLVGRSRDEKVIPAGLGLDTQTAGILLQEKS